MKKCTGCRETYPESAFYKDRAKPDGLTCRCKACHSAANGKTYGAGRRQFTPVGTRFGRLTSVAIDEWVDGAAYITCECQCGTRRRFNRLHLRAGRSRSCGCLRAEIMSEIKGTHRGSDSVIFGRWAGMRQRCGNPNHKNFDRYGGRGVTVCDEWASDFLAFRGWALANGFSDDLELDRIDNDKGYSPENCRWVTHIVNSRNRVHYSKRKNDTP